MYLAMRVPTSRDQPSVREIVLRERRERRQNNFLLGVSDSWFLVKSYLLENIASSDQAVAELRRILPGQENPWLLNAADGSTIAYFNVCLNEGAAYVSADMSGRHYNEDDHVRSVLQQLGTTVS